MKIRPALVVLQTSAILLLACADPIEFFDPEEYFPLEVGMTWIYEVDSVIYDLTDTGLTRDSSTIQQRWHVVSSREFEGAMIFNIILSNRSSASDDWNDTGVVVLERGTDVIRNDGNLSFVLWDGPLQLGSSWNGNRRFADDIELTIAGEVIKPYQDWSYTCTADRAIAPINYDVGEQVIEIIQTDADFVIERRYSRELYARDLGLVYREQQILDTQCRALGSGDITLCDGIEWPDKAEKGWYTRYSLISFER